MVQCGITIKIYANKKFLVDFNLVVAQAVRQTPKFNSPPNFLPIWYIMHTYMYMYDVTRIAFLHGNVPTFEV